jgi:hypothetical protein
MSPAPIISSGRVAACGLGVLAWTLAVGEGDAAGAEPSELVRITATRKPSPPDANMIGRLDRRTGERDKGSLSPW